MNETSKSKRYWGDLEWNALKGRGIDIGCGKDPVCKDALCFDIDTGDANCITDYIQQQYDYVYSSHCLEHMNDPATALLGWWKLVRPGGHLFIIVPDEDLYEQGVFPSRFNPDHKATFTISKDLSWSPVSHNLLDMIRQLQNAELLKIVLQDQGLDRSKLTHGPLPQANRLQRVFYFQIYQKRMLGRWGIKSRWIEKWINKYYPVDQTFNSFCLAQIECIVRKAA